MMSKDTENFWVFKALNGIVDINFNTEKSIEEFCNFVLSGLKKSGHIGSNFRNFRLLDTSMNDSYTILQSTFRKANEIRAQNENSGGIQILLADPYSEFARNRAESISKNPFQQPMSPMKKMEDSLEQIIVSMRDLAETQQRRPLPSCMEGVKPKLEFIHEYGKDFGLRLLLYSDVPSGPMYFFQNILLKGRFCVGESAVNLPWMMIIDDPNCSKDFYNVFSDEFDRIWKLSEEENYQYPKEKKLKAEETRIRELEQEISRLKAEFKILSSQANSEENQPQLKNQISRGLGTLVSTVVEVMDHAQRFLFTWQLFVILIGLLVAVFVGVGSKIDFNQLLPKPTPPQ
ncbi:hypothetical protein [Moorena sp. SIO3B2]|uniref:hypothetical protein n=1 Tax=Moorena sp. SIO3B2 TaxID=2607827 RepID=UPI0013C99653|nr:hypothetical protein [Moorena sp. SIO3B2]NEP36642.1 hypothetical protein [Moorena sp. SIO3B2]